MDATERTRLRALCAEATERPWKTDGAVIVTNFDDEPTPLARAEMEPSPGVDADDVDYQDRANAALIVGAVNALPAMLNALPAMLNALDAAERERAELETLRAEAALMREQLAAMTAQVEELEESAQSACQSPADDCDCAGCLYAAERGGES
jgi:hypothetical protein